MGCRSVDRVMGAIAVMLLLGTALAADAPAPTESGDAIEAMLGKEPEPHRAEFVARLLLHVGQADKVPALLRKLKDEDRTPGTHLLIAESYLLRQRLGLTTIRVGNFTDPSRLLDMQMEGLDQGLKEVAAGLERLEELRRRPGPDAPSAGLYKQYRCHLLVLKAELLMEQGDVRYRIEAPSRSRQARGGARAGSAMVKYDEARQALYEALLMDQHAMAQDLADRIDLRVRWLEEGRFFGGLSYYQLDPFLGEPGADPTFSPLNRLNRFLEDRGRIHNLEVMFKERGDLMGTAERMLLQEAKEIAADRDRATYRKQLRREHLMERLDALQARLADLKKGTDAEKWKFLDRKSTEAREDAYHDADLKSGLEGRKEALERDRKLIAKELDALVRSLKETSTKEQLRQATISERADKLVADLLKLPRTLDDVRKGVVDSWLNDTDPISTRLGKLASQLQQAERHIGRVENDIRRVKIQIEMAASKINEERLGKAIGDVKARINRQENELKQFLQGAGELAERLKGQIADQMARAIRDEIKAIEGHIGRAEKYLAHAKGFLETFKDIDQKVESAMVAARTAIMAAGNIPSGIITGMANGVFTERPRSLMEAARMGVQLLEKASKTFQTIEEGLRVVEDIQRQIGEYRKELGKLNAEYLKQQLENELQKVRDDIEGKKRNVDVVIAQLQSQSQGLLNKLNEERLRFQELAKGEVEARLADAEAALDIARLGKQEKSGALIEAQSKARLLVGQCEQAIEAHEKLSGQIARLDTELEKIDQEARRRASGGGAAGAQVAGATDADQPVRGRDEIEAKIVSTLEGEALRVYREIQEVLREIDSLKAEPAGRGPIPIALDGLASLGHGTSVKTLSSTYLAGLDEVNQLLFTYANWLYFMLGTEEALKWAIVCSNHEEARLVKDKLDGLRQQLINKTKGPPRFFAVEIDLEKDIPDRGRRPEGELWFRVDTGPGALSTADRGRRRREIPPGAEGAEFPRSPVTGPEADEEMHRFLVDVYDDEAGSRNLLWDVWVVPVWRPGSRGDLDQMPVGIEPIGPTGYRSGGFLTEVPVIYLDARQDHQRSLHSHASISGYRVGEEYKDAKTYLHTNPPRWILGGEFPTPNYGLYMGRGLTNTWRLVAPSEYTGSPSPIRSTLADLEKVVVWFGYVPFKLRNNSDAQAGRDGRSVDVTYPPILRPGPTGDAVSAARDRADRYRSERDVVPGQSLDFEVSPAGRLARLEMLEQTLTLLPGLDPTGQSISRDRSGLPDDHEQVLPSLSPDLRKLLDATDAGKDRRARIEGLAAQVINTEVLAARGSLDDPAISLIGPVRLKSIWDISLQPLLEGTGERQGFAGEVRESRMKLEAAVKVIRDVKQSIDPLSRFASRLEYDLETLEGQEKLVGELEQLVAKLLNLNGVQGRLNGWKEFIAAHQKVATWLAPVDLNGRNAGPSENVARLRRFLLDRLFEKWVKDIDEAISRPQVPAP